MRIAVVGGTGLVGRYTVDALRKAGHEPVVISRSNGVDVFTGKGLDAALAKAATVVDVSNVTVPDADATLKFFETATRNLLAAEERAGVKHHVLISIVGLDRIKGNAHYAGKRLQEEVVESGKIPFTIQRASQFHEFPAMVVEWTRQGDTAHLPPVLLQPVAAKEVGVLLAEVAAADPQRRAKDFSGPEPQDMIDMARRTLAARGESIHLIPTWRGFVYGVEAAGEIMLPNPDAQLGKITFDQWLKEQTTSAFKAAGRQT